MDEPHRGGLNARENNAVFGSRWLRSPFQGSAIRDDRIPGLHDVRCASRRSTLGSFTVVPSGLSPPAQTNRHTQSTSSEAWWLPLRLHVAVIG